jgi:hypothetical protein
MNPIQKIKKYLNYKKNYVLEREIYFSNYFHHPLGNMEWDGMKYSRKPNTKKCVCWTCSYHRNFVYRILIKIGLFFEKDFDQAMIKYLNRQKNK